MKMSKLERKYQKFFPPWIQYIVLFIGVCLIAALIFQPDIFDGHATLVLWIAIPYTLISFWFTGYFKGRIDSESGNQNNKE